MSRASYAPSPSAGEFIFIFVRAISELTSCFVVSDDDVFILCDVCDNGGHLACFGYKKVTLFLIRAREFISNSRFFLKVPKVSWYCSAKCLEKARGGAKPAKSKPKCFVIPGLTNIVRRPSGRHSVEIGINGNRNHLGTFDTVSEAVDAYNAVAARHGMPTQRVPPEYSPEPRVSLFLNL